MNYELAKQLKEAGFPEITRIGAELNLQRYRRMDNDSVSFPFLQELIAECGNKVILWQSWLCRNEDRGGDLEVWFADIVELGSQVEKKNNLGEYYVSGYIDESFDPVWGLTPEEAVANLWLELNKLK